MKKKPRFCQSERWNNFKDQLNNVSPEEAKELIKESDPVIIDVRTSQELDGNSIKGAIHMDYFDDGFIDKLLSLDKNRDYLVFCRTGRRSLRVCTWMNNSGFQRIHHLDGGLDTWKDRA